MLESFALLNFTVEVFVNFYEFQWSFAVFVDLQM